MKQFQYEMKSIEINLEHTINSGQVFLWQKINEYWYGVDGQRVIKVDGNGIIKTSDGSFCDFFRLNDKIKTIIEEISQDKTVSNAVRKYRGLRITRQDPFQCLVSFIVSSNSNIQKIKSTLYNICEKFGKKTKFDGIGFFLFPTPERLASASVEDIKKCGAGYRSKFILQAAKKVATQQINLDELKRHNYDSAKSTIRTIPGIGNKVADCILLFSLEKLESFPLDRWMIRTLQRHYSDKFKINTKTITERQHNILHEKLVQHFGKSAGYAQQYLFKMQRDDSEKQW